MGGENRKRRELSIIGAAGACVEEKIKENRAIWSIDTMFTLELLWKSGERARIP